MSKITAESIINSAMATDDKMKGSDFPLHIFPPRFQDIARTTSHCMGYSLDFLASSMLFAVSVAVGNTHALHVRGDWFENPILYMAITGKPGTNKSHPMSFAMKPLLNHDLREHRLFKSLYAEYQQLVSLTKKEREEMGHTETPMPPRLKKFVVSDVTQEGLVYIHEQNQRGICVYVDELKSWINNFNRYSKGSEEQFWLTNFNGKPIIVDRRGVENSISVPKSFIGVLGSIQLSRLSDLNKGERSDNGFIDRLLFVVPKLMDKRCWNEDELPLYITSQWAELMERFISLELHLNENGDPSPAIVHYGSDAKRRLYEWQAHNTQLCNSELDERLVGIYMKLEIYVSRFALLIQMIKWACGESDKNKVDTHSIESAIILTEYFRDSARRVQRIIDSNFAETLNTAQRSLLNALPNEFTTAQGVAVARTMNISERTFKDFVSRHISTLFIREKHGHYIKINN